jgi:large subunit ribosomal protein L3
MKALLGKKHEQSQVFTPENVRMPVTQISIENCFVTQIKTPETDGYFGLQMGLATRSPKNIGATYKGKTKKAGIENPLNFLREVRIDEELKPELVEENGKKGIKVGERVIMVGTKLLPSEVFQKGDKITVTGISKGKGFAGVMKRHGFAGGPATHGQSDRARSPGAIGSRTIPGRVFKGKRMAGRMGSDTVTVRGLTVMDATENMLTVSGVIPGSRHSVVVIKAQK